MPALSLWLLPPPTHPLTPTLSTLISQTIPSFLPSSSSASSNPPKPPTFSPHITLASGIPAARFSEPRPEQGKSEKEEESLDLDEGRAQKWLSDLPFPTEGDSTVRVRFEGMEVGREVFKKVTLRVSKEGGKGTEGLKEVAMAGRREGVEDGDRGKVAEWVRGEWAPHCSLLYSDFDVDSTTAAKMEQAVRDAGVEFVADGEESGKGMNGWDGGRVWLVDTQKRVEEWKPIAERVL